jgi:hypothetical protein
MIRKLTVVAALLIAGAASAAETGSLRGNGAYGSAGCGLGSMVFGSQPGGIQIIAATLNGTGVQTFGITSGTSNCGSGLIASGTKDFVETNREALAKDMSRGQGDTIGAISQLAGCKDTAGVGTTLQSNYGAIIPSEQATAEEIAARLLQTLKANQALGCQIG